MRHSVVESEKRLARRLNGGQGQRGSAILYGMNNLAEREPQIAFRSVEPRAARPELPPSRQSRCYCSRASLINLMTTSVHVCTHLLANGDFVTALAKSLARRFTLKVLPVDLPDRAWPVVIITLKNRTLSPVVELFIERARQFTRPMCAEQPTPKQ